MPCQWEQAWKAVLLTSAVAAAAVLQTQRQLSHRLGP